MVTLVSFTTSRTVIDRREEVGVAAAGARQLMKYASVIEVDGELA